MTAEYRRMLRSQELHGSEAIGWLDPDEVAWLEEEMEREKSRSQSSTGAFSALWMSFALSRPV